MSEVAVEEPDVVEDHGAVPAGTGEFSSDEQKAAYIAALVEEKAAYELRGLTSEAAEVAAELARVGGGGKTARKRGEAR